MELKDICANLEWSQKLRELGYPQGDSLFVWVDKFPLFSEKIRISSRDEFNCQLSNSILSNEAKALIKIYAAPTCSELGEWLPDHISCQKIDAPKEYWLCCDERKSTPENEAGLIDDDTLANAMAKMACYLIENKLWNPKN
jgi:hypothetical protein